jgi:hypothetical protein
MKCPMTTRAPGLRRHLVRLLACAAACSSPVADVGGLSTGTSGGGETTGASASSSETSPTSGSPTPASTGGADSSDGGTSPADTGADTGPSLLLDVGNDTPPVGCDSEVGDFIYLLDVDAGLHRIAPGSLEVESLGPLACDGASSAMALTVDRNGMLWAMMVDDQGYRGIYTVDPISLACSPTDFVDPIAENIGVNSLAFVADAPDSETESLYIGANVGGSFDFEIPLSLGRVDLDTMDMEIVGTAAIVPTGYYQIADLTGTGDSRLFGFFPGDVAVIAELDESSSSLVSDEILDFGVGSPWAFAQWAGRLWLFSSSGNPGSDIRAWDPITGDVEEIHPGIGVDVVGAAVSTCAPYQPEG